MKYTQRQVKKGLFIDKPIILAHSGRVEHSTLTISGSTERSVWHSRVPKRVEQQDHHIIPDDRCITGVTYSALTDVPDVIRIDTSTVRAP